MKHPSIGTMANRLGVPEGVVGKAPIISIFGTEKAAIEKHGAIFEYTPERIRVDSASGLVTISGKYLTITLFTKNCLEVTGEIRSVEVGAE
ncbi:MAG: YabP/YqfC family sporulation protein [Clostridia bacterium]|nr:YabP/YqfC family sporulation protein [Clostridia bacterium]